MKKCTSQEIKEFVSKPLFDEKIILAKDPNYPKISIVTPSYNQGQFIEDCILSVKNQTYKNFEHTIIDGRSTDNTIKILKSYESVYNMRWVSERDGGMYSAINKGMEMSKGDIIAYLNTDDLYFPWTLQVVIDYFNRHPEVEIIYGDMINMNLQTGKTELVFSPKFNLSLLTRKNFIGQPTVFFRRSVIQKIGFFSDDLRLIGDYDYWIRASKQCRISKIREVLATDRIHLKSLRQRELQRLSEELIYIRKMHVTQKENKLKRYLVELTNCLPFFVVNRFSMARFMFYYLYLIKMRKSFANNRMIYPWQNLIKYSKFRVISWNNFFITTIPWVNRKYKKNWFTLDM